MENNLQIWVQKTKTIWTGVLLLSICGIFFGIISGLSSAADTAGAIMGAGGGGFVKFLYYLVLAAVIAGYAMYVLGLGNFREILSAQDSDAINKVRIGAILEVVAYLWGAIGFWGWAAKIISIIAFIYMLLGFMALKNSSTFPAKARRGASNLFLSMVLGVVASIVALILGWIPIVKVIGAFIEGFLNLCAFILVLVGWNQVRKADPTVLL